MMGGENVEKISKLKLLNFDFFKKYEKIIVRKNILYFSDIAYLNLKKINMIFETDLCEGKKILSHIDLIKFLITQNKIDEIYNYEYVCEDDLVVLKEDCNFDVILEKDKIDQYDEYEDVEYQDDEYEDDQYDDFDEFKEDTNEIYISKIGLSVRATNALLNFGFTYVSEIINLSYMDLLLIRNMGTKSAKEILSFINKYKETPEEYENLKGDTFLDKANLIINEDTMIKDLGLSVRTYNCLVGSGYTKFKEIINLSKEQFFKIPNMGRKSVNEIVDIIEHYGVVGSRINEEILKQSFDTYCDSVNDFKYQNYPILKFYEFNKDDELKKILHQIDPFINIEKFTFKSLLLYLYNIICSSNYLLELMEHFLKFYDYYLNLHNFNFNLKLDDKIKFIIKERKKGVRLQTIGNKFGVSRERIRQLENNGIRKIKNFVSRKKIRNILLDDIYTKENNTILDDDLYEILFYSLDEFFDVEKIIIKDEMIFVSKESYNYINDKFLKIKNDIMCYGVILKSEIDLSMIDSRILPYFFEKNKISISEVGYYAGDKLYDKLMSYMKRFKIIDLKDSNLENLKQTLNKFVNLKDFDKHNIVSSLNRKGEVAPMGESNYILVNHIPKLEEDVFSELKDKIKELKVIDCYYLHRIYKSKLPEIYTPTVLYFVLKIKFNDEFNFGGTNLNISILGVNPSKASNVYDELMKSKEPVANVNLMSKFNLDKTALAVIDGQNNDIFYLDDVFLWLYSKMKHLDFITEKLKNYLNRNQSFYLADIYTYMRSIAKEQLETDNITTIERFHRLLKSRCGKELKDYTYDRFKKIYIKNKKNEVAIGFDLDF